MAYGPGVNEINYTDLPPTGDTIASAAQKTQNQFDALYTGLNADIVRASAAEVNTAEDTTKIVTPGTLLKGKASGVASLNESGKVTGTELPNASSTVKGVVELATPDEVKQGTDNERAVTPEGFKAAFGEFYPIGAEPTYVDANNFTVAGDLTAIFTKGRVLKITDTGGTVYAVVRASVYDTATTVTIAGDTIDSGISAVLYAVQQHTGAIWERGVNTNGEYIKFADGTMICYALALSATNLTVNEWKAYSYTLPAVFYTAPVVSPDLSIGTGWAAVVDIQSGGSSTTQVTILLITNNGDYLSLNNGVQYIAIGRWF